MQMIPLPRHTLTGPDDRRVRVYGELRGGLDPRAPVAEASALHLRWDAITASWIAVSPAETAALLFINDTLPEASAARLAALPVVPREEHEPFIVEPVQ